MPAVTEKGMWVDEMTDSTRTQTWVLRKTIVCSSCSANARPQHTHTYKESTILLVLSRLLPPRPLPLRLLRTLPHPPGSPPPIAPSPLDVAVRFRDQERDSDPDCEVVTYAECKRIVELHSEANPGYLSTLRVSFGGCEGLEDEVDCFFGLSAWRKTRRDVPRPLARRSGIIR